jgi:hypothetical protein
LAVLINKLFFNVYYKSDTDNNLYLVWKLYCVQIGMCVIPMFFVWLIPTKESVKLVQIKLAEDFKAAADTRQELLDEGVSPEVMIENIKESVVMRASLVMRNSEVKRNS